LVQSTQLIEHQGIVTKVDGKTVEVKIEAASACSHCHAKGACLASDMVEKIVEVNRGDAQVSVGQAVTVVLKRSLGFHALLLGYLLPFIVSISTLVAALHVAKSEVIAGLMAILILSPYYLLLYMFRHRIKGVFQFKLRP